MKRRLVPTSDGTPTLALPGGQEHYHSLHGALQEARHVFIANGLDLYKNRDLRILEMGFGTGLNALVSLLEAPLRGLRLNYTGLEAFPVTREEWEALDYGTHFPDPAARGYFGKLHEVPWGLPSAICPWFTLSKWQTDLLEFRGKGGFDLVYFDAFGAGVQPELWTEPVFRNMFAALDPGGRLVTYAAKGSVRRAMLAAGFVVERLPGPPGKREMLRATRRE